jgi:hypothetical protein
MNDNIIKFPNSDEVTEEEAAAAPETLAPTEEQLKALFDPTLPSGIPTGYLFVVMTHEGHLRLGYGGNVSPVIGTGMLEVAKQIWLELNA